VQARDSIGVVALHDLNLAARFADHLILLGQGRILAQGCAKTVLCSPAISETYKVDVEISTGPREDLTVHAYAS
jgi:iron complex transport system ATP-binding protein